MTSLPPQESEFTFYSACYLEIPVTWPAFFSFSCCVASCQPRLLSSWNLINLLPKVSNRATFTDLEVGMFRASSHYFLLGWECKETFSCGESEQAARSLTSLCWIQERGQEILCALQERSTRTWSRRIEFWWAPRHLRGNEWPLLFHQRLWHCPRQLRCR